MSLHPTFWIFLIDFHQILHFKLPRGGIAKILVILGLLLWPSTLRFKSEDLSDIFFLNSLTFNLLDIDVLFQD